MKTQTQETFEEERTIVLKDNSLKSNLRFMWSKISSSLKENFKTYTLKIGKICNYV